MKVKFAVVGCGYIGKRHAELIVNNAECELVALCDVKPKEDLKIEKYQVPFFNDIDDLLKEDLGIDVVCVTTPNGLHAAFAIRALKASKHVVVEKPMALSKHDCEQIIYEALGQSKQVFCVMQNRYSPPSMWLKDLISNKILGKIYLVQVNCYWNRDERYYTKGNWHGTKDLDGGTLFTQFSHFIDIMYWLFGDITNIKSRIRNFNHHNLTEFEDSGFVNFDFISGGIGSFNFSTSVWNQNLESSLTIIAENGTIKIGGQYMDVVEICNIKDYKMPVLPPSNPPNDYGAYKGSAANHMYVFDNVVDVLKRRSSITTNALEGLKVIEIIQKIYESK